MLSSERPRVQSELLHPPPISGLAPRPVALPARAPALRNARLGSGRSGGSMSATQHFAESCTLAMGVIATQAVERSEGSGTGSLHGISASIAPGWNWSPYCGEDGSVEGGGGSGEEGSSGSGEDMKGHGSNEGDADLPHGEKRGRPTSSKAAGRKREPRAPARSRVLERAPAPADGSTRGRRGAARTRAGKASLGAPGASGGPVRRGSRAVRLRGSNLQSSGLSDDSSVEGEGEEPRARPRPKRPRRALLGDDNDDEDGVACRQNPLASQDLAGLLHHALQRTTSGPASDIQPADQNVSDRDVVGRGLSRGLILNQPPESPLSSLQPQEAGCSQAAAPKRSRAAQHLLDLLGGGPSPSRPAAETDHGSAAGVSTEPSCINTELPASAKADGDSLRAFFCRPSIQSLSSQSCLGSSSGLSAPQGPSDQLQPAGRLSLEQVVTAGSHGGSSQNASLAPRGTNNVDGQSQALSTSLQLLERLEALPKRSLGSDWKSLLGGGHSKLPDK